VTSKTEVAVKASERVLTSFGDRFVSRRKHRNRRRSRGNENHPLEFQNHPPTPGQAQNHPLPSADQRSGSADQRLGNDDRLEVWVNEALDLPDDESAHRLIEKISKAILW
jgi:hypothetical protein